MELYRYLMDDFLISYCRDLTPKDFELKGDALASRRGKRIFLNKHRNKGFLIKLEEYFQKLRSNPSSTYGKETAVK
jgi:hypothetical protein